MRKIILVTASGEDRPGLTATLTSVLADSDVDVLDIGQAVIHNWLTLGLLIAPPPGRDTDAVLKDLLFAAYELGLKLKFKPIADPNYTRWVKAQGKKRHIVTILGPRIVAGTISSITRIVAEAGLNIDNITRLSGRTPLDEETAPGRACVELSVRGTPKNKAALRKSFMDAAAESGVDIAFQEDNVFRRNRRLVALDMDSTLIAAEGIDELAARAGVGDQVAAITARAMNGELDFQESFKERLALLAGLPESVLMEVADTMPLNRGAERLISNLKHFGFKIAIISGGFTYFGERLRQELGIDYLFANEMEIEDGVVTGRVKGAVVDGPRKARLLRKIAKLENISLQQVVAVGDGANDLPMLNIAGLGIAFHAKPKVKQDAGQSISTLGLDSILYLMGLRDREIVK